MAETPLKGTSAVQQLEGSDIDVQIPARIGQTQIQEGRTVLVRTYLAVSASEHYAFSQALQVGSFRAGPCGRARWLQLVTFTPSVGFRWLVVELGRKRFGWHVKRWHHRLGRNLGRKHHGLGWHHERRLHGFGWQHHKRWYHGLGRHAEQRYDGPGRHVEWRRYRRGRRRNTGFRGIGRENGRLCGWSEWLWRTRRLRRR